MSSIKLELNDFRTPNFVIPKQSVGLRQDGFRPAEGIPLRELSVETLDELCLKFRADVFKKADKVDPREAK